MRQAVRQDGAVTVVIAAYQRPEALNKTLASLYRQSYRKWKALIVADCCPAGFSEQLDLRDDRVRLINLPLRCGHQYGPNSVGIHFADSEYLAFLNHDDLWLEDHLELAVNAMRTSPANAYLGRAAFCHLKNQPGWPDGDERVLFSELNRPEYLWRCMSGPIYFFEPASAWVVETAMAKQVGYWLAPDQTQTTPVVDWLMRLAGAGARFQVGELVSVLKFNLHHRKVDPEKPTYYQQEPWLAKLDRFLTVPAARIREEIADDLEHAAERGLQIRDGMSGQLAMTPAERDRLSAFLFYLNTGIINTSVAESLNHDYSPAAALRWITGRTGEQIDSFPPPSEIMEMLSAGTGE